MFRSDVGIVRAVGDDGRFEVKQAGVKFRLVPADSTNLGGYPLVVLPDGLKSRAILVTSPGVNVVGEPFSTLHVDTASLGGGRPGDTWRAIVFEAADDQSGLEASSTGATRTVLGGPRFLIRMDESNLKAWLDQSPELSGVTRLYFTPQGLAKTPPKPFNTLEYPNFCAWFQTGVAGAAGNQSVKSLYLWVEGLLGPEVDAPQWIRSGGDVDQGASADQNMGWLNWVDNASASFHWIRPYIEAPQGFDNWTLYERDEPPGGGTIVPPLRRHRFQLYLY